jgi:hypothetical protein
MRRIALALARCWLLTGMTLSACVYELPLGGIAPSHPRPLPGRSFQLGLSAGLVPDVSGTIPEIHKDGRVLNQIPDVSTMLTGSGWGMFGVAAAAGLDDWIDLGFSSSRGFYSTVRLWDAGGWALSASPAFYLHSVSGREPDGFDEGRVWTRITNRNLTGLLSFQAPTTTLAILDLFVGYGVSRYSVSIRDQWRNHQTTVPSVVGGFTLDRGSDRDGGITRALRLSFDASGTWLTQRDGRRDFVVSNRVQMALRLRPVW